MVSYLSLGVYVLLSFATGLFTSSVRLSIWFLQGLHSYLYPENSIGQEQQDAQFGNGLVSMKEKEAESSVDGFNASEGRSVYSVARAVESEGLKEGRDEGLDTEGIAKEDSAIKRGDKGENKLVSECASAREQDCKGQEICDGHHLSSKKESSASGDSILKSKVHTKDKTKVLPKSTKKRKEKGKDRFDWDEGSSQILRLSLGDSQLQGRQYFQEYDQAVIYSVVGLTNLLAREFLSSIPASNSLKSSQWVGFLRSDDFIPFLMGSFATYKIVRLLARVGWERNTSRKSELVLSCCVGFLGFLLAFGILNLFPTTLIDFGFEKVFSDAGMVSSISLEKESKQQTGFDFLSPSIVKIILAASAGYVSGILMGPAHRSVRSFWLGTDQLQWNMSVINWGPVAHFLLHLNIVMPLFTSMLWIKPMGEPFICKPAFEASGQYLISKPRDLSIYRGMPEELSGWQERPSSIMRTGVKAVDEQSTEVQDHWGEDKFVLHQEEGQENHITEGQGQGEEAHNIHNPTLRNTGRVNGRMYSDLSNENEGKEEAVSFWGKLFFPASSGDWTLEFGMISEKTFEEVRLWSLLVTGVLQLCLFRVNLQSYLNDAILIWYESLHRSKVINLELTRAKLILNNYFLCRAAIQFLVPGMLVVLFLGMSRVWGNQLSSSTVTGTSFLASLFIRSTALFMAWWVTFVWAVLTSIILTLYRLGFLLAS